MPEETASVIGQWTAMAMAWGQNGPPLRPNAEDVGHFQRTVELWQAHHPHRPPRPLILGVTPELYRLRWPAGTEVRGIDRTEAMIVQVWPGPRDAAIHADWLHIPFADASMDLVLCDGGLHLLAHPGEQRTLARKLAAVVAPGGYCVFRLFVPPDPQETAEAVIADLLAGRIPDLNYLKLRLATAMQPGPAAGVSLDAVWHLLHALEPDQAALARRLGWAPEHLAVIDAYRGSPARYHFVDVDTAVALFCTATDRAFELQRIDLPEYRLGRQCPTLTFLRTA